MRVPRGVLAGVVVAVALAGAIAVSPQAALAWVESLASRPLLFGAAVAGLYAVRPFLAWPPTLCAAVVGYGYGVVGAPVALLGAGVTALVPFYATRWALEGDSPAVLGWIAGPADRVQAVSREYFATAGGVRGVTAARLAPIPADLVSCGAAASGLDARPLFLGTLVGEIPWTVGAVLVGASAGSLVAVGDLSDVGLPIALAGAAGALAVLAGPAYRYLGPG